MHVHWREEWEDGVEDWHAHTVATYPLRLHLEPYEQLHTHISNTMDWGCTTRRMEIEKQAKVIGKRKWPDINEDDVDFACNKRQRWAGEGLMVMERTMSYLASGLILTNTTLTLYLISGRDG